MGNYTIAIHGGAGTILQSEMTPELEKAYTDGLQQALDAGYAVLDKGGNAVDAVTIAVTTLENNILFNAGRGAVFTKQGLHEMDAAIMDGIDLRAGAVAGVRNIKNPIELALRVMRNSDHVFLSGEGANEFASKQALQIEPDDYFFSQFRYDQWLAVRDSDTYLLDHDSKLETSVKDKKFGTVGAVACDIHGNIAAATSTGGMTNKQYGRIGDSPLIGAGTYANNRTCAISCTGHGELFIRSVAAYDVSCLMEYKGLNLDEAMRVVVLQKLVAIQGEGGMIGVDAQGNASLVFNSEGMYRGVRNNVGLNEIAIYK
ncbi:MAG: isoaspartyl peptidase/L-asparaginase family protein [Sediminibacterium sp.]|jgi:beta-aspartyl-peptidase (threonine type)|nr:isoaspartyl peptidase/L-asparaginase [Chitinophagaceae bacterium]MCA6447126.1 isoaspartyl peptidase/L-asparaginase [Chitinophagaceae bacterium]